MAGISYSIKKNRIQKGIFPGFTLSEDGALVGDAKAPQKRLYIRAIDSGKEDSSWGRFWYQGTFSESMVAYLYVAAMNEDSFYRNGRPVKIEDFLCDPDEDDQIKREFWKQVGALRFVNQTDVLLYGLHGRYLYVAMEVYGAGDCRISNLRVDSQGDPFMKTFPEVYRQENGFFHRYLSVFSSIYQDFEEEIGQMPQFLDLDTCPAELLPVYGRWLGIDVGKDFLEEEVLRPLVKEAYELNRMKGTRYALERIGQIVLGERVLVIERNRMEDYIGQEQLEEFERLYGNNRYDVTVMIQKEITEVKKSQLLFLLQQFKPVRARIHLIMLRKRGALDDYSYLDMNARIPDQREAILDTSQELDGSIRLE